MRFIPFYLVLILALAACGTEEPPPPDPAPAEPELQADPDVEEPEAATRDDEDALEEVRQRRERLREEMREHRRTGAEDGRRDRPRAATEPETDWWRDEAMVTELGLDDQQIVAIEEAATIHRQARSEGRRQMVELRRQLSRDRTGEPGDGAAEAREQREQLRGKLEAANRDWRMALEETLDASQLEQLEAARPEALSPRMQRRLGREAEDNDEEPSPPAVD